MSFYQEKTPIGMRIAQAVGITASAYLFGQNAGISYIAVPAIMEAPAPLAVRQWEKAYNIGKSIAPFMVLCSAIATGYTAYHQDPKSLPFKLNLAATLLIPSIVPFTFIAMIPINAKLLEKRKQLASTTLDAKDTEVGVAKEDTVHALLDEWAGLNLARALLVGVGSICTVWASLSKLDVVAFSEVGLRTGANRLR